MVIASKNFRDEEYLKPRRVLESAGIKVTVASSSTVASKGMLGGVVKPDILLKNSKGSDYDGILFVGGAGAREYWSDEKAHSLAKTMAVEGKIVSAICIAPVILANAGLLKGRRCTVFPNEKDKVTAKGGDITSKDVERDENIITASGPSAATKFAEEILKALGNEL